MKLKKYFEHPAVKITLDEFIKMELDLITEFDKIDLNGTLIKYNQYAYTEIRNYKLKQLGI
jgi:hypothetical protein